MMRRVARVLIVAAATAAAVTGCASQIAGLAPVSGEDLVTARIATIDAVLAQKLTIRDAPTCTSVDGQVSCVGTLTDGATIQSTTRGPEGSELSVVVNGTVIYDGPLEQVLNDAAQDTR